MLKEKLPRFFFSYFNITLVMKNPKGISNQMMTCSVNPIKHFKKLYQTKINKEMSQHDFQFFGNLMIFFSKKIIDQVFPFHIYFSHLCKSSNEKKKCVLNVSITLSHFERIT